MNEFSSGNLISQQELKEALLACGRGVRVYRGCRIQFPENVELGSYCQIDEGVRIFAGKGVKIGRNVHFAFDSSISGGGTCLVGKFASVGAGVRILTGSDIARAGYLNNPTVPSTQRCVKREKTEIGEFSIVYTNSVVFPGVRIGEGAIVAAGSVVNRDLSPWVVYGGHPLVAIGRRKSSQTILVAEQLAHDMTD